MTQPMRRDARRNVERLTTAAAQVFEERGLDAPLEEIAQVAGVSAGTLYNRFGGRDALIDAVLPDRVGSLVRDATERAEAEPDPWTAFAQYVTAMCELQAGDLALNDAFSRRFPEALRLTEICDAQLSSAKALIDRAKEAGALRSDFTSEDLPYVFWSVSMIVRATAGIAPDTWRRALAFTLDGLRAEAASTPAPGAPMTPDQVRRAMLGVGDRKRSKG